jgi:hypothetical protein
VANSFDVTIGNSAELVLSGGPATVNLEVDFGPQGERGSRIFVGYGNPNESGVSFPEDPIILDMFINISQYSQTAPYLGMYQYVLESGSEVWKYVVTILPSIYSDNYEVGFIDGEVTVNIPLNSFVPASILSTVEASNFNVQVNVQNQNPVSIGASSGTIQTDSGIRSLPLDIKAIEYSGTSWIPLEGEKTVQLFITMV